MSQHPSATDAEATWAMIYHQGLPVAVCAVRELGPESLEVECGPLRFDRDDRLAVVLARDHEALQLGRSVAGAVEGYEGDRMRVRLDPLPRPGP